MSRQRGVLRRGLSIGWLPGRLKYLGLPLVVLVLVGWPTLVQSDYIIGVAITALIFVGLAVSFDLVVGRLGMLTFAHPAFFGIGAYIAALVAIHWNFGYLEQSVAAAVVASLVAVVIGIPCFRLSLHAFAMGTLGFAQVAYVVAQSWTEVTGGPECIPGVPPARLSLGPWEWTATSVTDYYYIALGLALLAVVIVRQLTIGRIGRTWTAIRDDEILATSNGVPLLKYRMLAFVTGGAIAGAVGAFIPSYNTLACPNQLALIYSITLIVMLFLGGRASLYGPIVGAVLFSALPEYLRVAQVWQMTVYGFLIIVASVFVPEGLVTWLVTRWRRVFHTTSSPSTV